MNQLIGVILFCAGMLGALEIHAQEYPTRPIRLVTGVAGGGTDFLARTVMPGVAKALEQPIVIDNRPALLTGEIVAKAPPDGYTLLINGTTFIVTPLLTSTPFDPLRDFAPISVLESSPNVMVVHPSLPVNSVKELIALAKAKPGAYNYASPSVGASAHLATELFKSMAGINIVHVPYKGGAAAVSGVLNAESQIYVSIQATVMPHVRSGKLKALAVTSAQPFPLVPGVPTVAASGLPGYEFSSMDFLLAPAKTPPAIINRINREVVRLLSNPEVQGIFTKAGIYAQSSTPEELGSRMKSDSAKVGKLIKEVGIRLE